MEGNPCSHENENGTYTCAPGAASGDGDVNKATPNDADYVCDHSDGCGYAEAVEEVPCTHSCELCESTPVETPPAEKPSAGNPPVKNEIVKDTCICDTKCTPANSKTDTAAVINPDCPVCSAEHADLTLCIGTEEKALTYDEVVALFAALPDADSITAETTEAQRDALTEQINLALDALDALSNEDYAKFIEEQADLLKVVAALQAAIVDAVPEVLTGEVTPAVDGENIYANGQDLKLEAGTKENYTKVSYRAMGTSEAYIPFEVSGATGNTTTGYDLSEYIVCGGSSTALTGDTKITMEDGCVKIIYGGGYDKSVNGKATVNGNTEVIINGGTVGDVYGGSFFGNVSGNTKVVIGEAATAEYVYGGGNYGAVGTQGNNNSAAVTIAGTVNEEVYGGGSNGNINSGGINGSASVTVTETGNVWRLYGGGSGAEVNGNISVVVEGKVGGNLCGGGSSSSYKVTGDSSIKITGTVERSVDSGSDKVSGKSTIIIGGGAKVGSSNHVDGVWLEDFSDQCFIIDPALTDSAAITARLPTTIGEGITIATNAAAGDETHISLDFISQGRGKTAYFEDNCIKVGTPAVTGVTIAPATSTVQKGNTQQFTATVSGTKNPPRTVTWVVSGNAKAGTSISADGLLTVAADETAATLTVTAASTFNTNKSGTATVTVSSTSLTDAQKIAAAKSAIQTALDNLTVTNAATAQDILNAAKAATQYGVAVEWDSTNGFGKTEAAKGVEGLITGTLKLLLNSESDTIAVNKTIAALPGDGSSDSGSSGGGSSSSGSSNGSSSAKTSPGVPVKSEIEISGTVDRAGSFHAELSQKAVEDAVKKAEERKKDSLSNGITLVLNVNTGGGSAGSVSVNLPKVTQETIISNKITNTVIVVDNPSIRIDMDLAAVTEIHRQAQADVNITATRQDNSRLAGAAKAAIGNRPAFDLKANYGDGKQVTEFGTGSVNVAIPYTLQSGEKSGGVCAVYVDSNGNVNYLTNSAYDSTNKTLRFTTSHFSTYGIGYKALSDFSDTASHWAEEDIQFVVNRGLLDGTSRTTFSPDAAITRGMIVTALGRLAGVDVSGYKASSFTDVKADAYYMGYAEWASQTGILSGTGAATYAPDSAISREQMAVVLANYARTIGYSLPRVHTETTFADTTNISSWAKDSVKTMQMAGIIASKDANKFEPQSAATRAEASATLRRFIERMMGTSTAQGWMQNDSGQWMYYINGSPIKDQTREIDGVPYAFDNHVITPDYSKKKSRLTHTVKTGDNLWKISREYNVDMQILALINGKSVSSTIYPGEVLKIPQ